MTDPGILMEVGNDACQGHDWSMYRHGACPTTSRTTAPTGELTEWPSPATGCNLELWWWKIREMALGDWEQRLKEKCS